MFRFLNPEYLYGLLLPIIFVISYLYLNWKRVRTIKRIGTPHKFWSMVENYSTVRTHVRFALVMISLSLLVIMLARPQWGIKKEVVKRNGIEVVFSLDVSNSMLANDIKPNRLERTKMLVSNLVERLDDNKIALNVFAGEAYPQLPITNDIVSVKLFLDAITPGMVTLQGTSIASAIEMAKYSFTKDEKVGKAIIIVTDGEDHEPGAVEAAKQAAEEGIKVFLLGVGTSEGATIPMHNGFLTDADGRYVRTILNEQACMEIAQAGGGKYVHVDNTNSAQKILQTEFDKMQKSESENSYSVYNEQFVAIALLAFIVMMVEFLLLEIVNPIYKRVKLFSK